MFVEKRCRKLIELPLNIYICIYIYGLNTVLVLNLWPLCQIGPQPFNLVSK